MLQTFLNHETTMLNSSQYSVFKEEDMQISHNANGVNSTLVMASLGTFATCPFSSTWGLVLLRNPPRPKSMTKNLSPSGKDRIQNRKQPFILDILFTQKDFRKHLSVFGNQKVRSYRSTPAFSTKPSTQPLFPQVDQKFWPNWQSRAPSRSLEMETPRNGLIS